MAVGTRFEPRPQSLRHPGLVPGSTGPQDNGIASRLSPRPRVDPGESRYLADHLPVLLRKQEPRGLERCKLLFCLTLGSGFRRNTAIGQ